MDLTILSDASTICGYISFTIWLFAQLPQIIENHLNKLVDGVNVIFLSSWIAGDVTNLLGCLLTRALPFQTLIASYYCFIDVILSFQYYYYTKIFPYHKTPHNMLQSPDMYRVDRSRSIDRLNRFDDTSQLLARQAGPVNTPGISRGRTKRSSRGRSSVLSVLTASLLTKRAQGAPIDINEGHKHVIYPSNEQIGRFLAWTCTFFYLSSRIPQIRTNYVKKSTTGISPYLFLFALLGNTFYTVSIGLDLMIIAKTPNADWVSHFWDQLPFIMGSGGTLTFDMVLLFQCWYYKKSSVHSRTVSVDGGFRQPDWYVNTFEYEDEPVLHDPLIDSPPPHHYISGSYSAGMGPSNSFSIINSISKSVRSKSSSMHSPVMQTHLIPSIINSYSSVSKKLANPNDKMPFLPSDFLNDEFYTPIENSSFTLNENSP